MTTRFRALVSATALLVSQRKHRFAPAIGTVASFALALVVLLAPADSFAGQEQWHLLEQSQSRTLAAMRQIDRTESGELLVRTMVVFNGGPQRFDGYTYDSVAIHNVVNCEKRTVVQFISNLYLDNVKVGQKRSTYVHPEASQGPLIRFACNPQRSD